MRIGTMGLTRHGLDEKQIRQAKAQFKEDKRAEYEAKYGSRAEEKLEAMSTPDRKNFPTYALLFYLGLET